MGLMTTRDFETYFSLFNLLDRFVQPPDLLVYLRASVPRLVSQIQNRGREYEEAIRLDYLKRLNERYEAWISTYDKGKLLIIDVDNNNFRDDPEDLGEIIRKIDAEVHGTIFNSIQRAPYLRNDIKKRGINRFPFFLCDLIIASINQKETITLFFSTPTTPPLTSNSCFEPLFFMMTLPSFKEATIGA